MDTVISSNCYIFETEQHVNQLTAPLFDYTDISFFAYSRYYPNNTLSILSTYADWTEAIFNQGKAINYQNIELLLARHPNINQLSNSHYYLLRDDNQDAFSLGRNYNINSTLVMIDKQDDFYELFCFASKENKELIRFYFNNWNYLVKFKYRFIEKGGKLIGVADKNKLKLSKSHNNDAKGNNNMPFNPEKLKEALQVDHYHILYQGKRVAITAREFDCLKGIGQGRTIKETGKLLGISPRTVEGYLNNLKDKLVIDQRSELINIYLSSDLIIL